MKSIDKRLLKLEKALAPLVDVESSWGSLAALRDWLLKRAAKLGPEALADLQKELEESGPTGLLTDLIRSSLLQRGFVQTGPESFAETLARFLQIDCSDLRDQLLDGTFKTVLLKRLEEVPALAGSDVLL